MIMKLGNWLATLIILIGVLNVKAQSSDEPFKVFNVQNEKTGETVVYATNEFPCEESVFIEFTALQNMKADTSLPFRGVVPAGAKKFKLFTLFIKDKSRASQLGYITRYCHGDIYTKKPIKNQVYTIPYRNGEQYPLEQGYGGNFSHNMPGRKYALDFIMPEGTEICAARGGVVVAVKDDSNKGGKTFKYQEYGNYIMIYHGDGTLANYFHLQKNGSKVQVGDVVEEGDVIGLSGNTGWSSGPHLHFQVYTYDKDMHVKSMPTKFRQPEGKKIVLEKNRKGYVSVHP